MGKERQFRCGLAYSEFKAKGRIGCPACYDAFAAVLIPLLEKVHNASKHTGKHPPHEAGPDLEPPSPESVINEESPVESAETDEMTRLTIELAAAVAAENYELAAELRDQIRALSTDESPDGL